MQDPDSLTSADRELALALGGLQPAATAIDRDRMMFRAGQATARRGRRGWQGLAAGLVLMLGVSIASRPTPSQVERVVYVAQESDPPAPAHRASWSPRERVHDFRGIQANYLKLRDDVLVHGLDALHESPQTAATSRRTSEPSNSPARADQEVPLRPGRLGDRIFTELGEQL